MNMRMAAREYVTLKVVKDTAEVWAAVEGAGNGMYKIDIIEKKLMNQVVVANAESLTAGIKEAGKVVVYGIYFDIQTSSRSSSWLEWRWSKSSRCSRPMPHSSFMWWGTLTMSALLTTISNSPRTGPLPWRRHW